MAKEIDISKIKPGDRVDIGPDAIFLSGKRNQVVEVNDRKENPDTTMNICVAGLWIENDQIIAHYPAKPKKARRK